MNYELLHQEPFAPEVFYIRNHFHQKKMQQQTFTPEILYTLHQNFLLRNSLQPGALPNKENLLRENLHKKVLYQTIFTT